MNKYITLKISTSSKILFLLFASFIILNFTCPDCDGNRLDDSTPYTIILNNTSSSLQLNDTLMLDLKLSSQMELALSGNTFDNSNQQLSFQVLIFEAIAGSNESVPAKDKFDFFGDPGDINTVSISDIRLSISNACDTDSCRISLGVIPKHSGYFGLALRTGIVGIDTECQFISLSQERFETDGNNNFEVLEEINLSQIRIDRSFYNDPGSDETLHFFKVE